MTNNLILYCDGLTEPTNPGGWACWAFCVLEAGAVIHEAYGCLGHGAGMTNNLAEYTAVIKALAWCQENFLDGMLVRTDSQLVVRQLQGAYAVRSPSILPLYQEAIALVHAVSPVLEWVPREQNTLADALTRKAYAEARHAGKAPGLTPLADDPLVDVLARLDQQARTVTDWEARFLDSLLRQMAQGREVSPKQRAVVQRMAAAYLSPEAAAEVAGQQRLI